MSQYNVGTVTVTNGSAILTGLSTLWQAEISVGDIFTLSGSAVWYSVGSVDSNTQITLAANYAGATASTQSYAITRDFTPVLGLPYPVQGDMDTAAVVQRAFLQLDAGITVSSFTHKGDWLTGTTYVTNDAVHSSGRYYVSKVMANTGHVPPVSPSTGDAWWGLVVDGNVAANTSLDAAATAADRVVVAADKAIVEADVLATGANRIAAQAAWTAALAANPDLNPALRMNPSTLDTDMTIPTSFNGYSAGPLTIGEGVNIIVGDNSNWNII